MPGSSSKGNADIAKKRRASRTTNRDRAQRAKAFLLAYGDEVGLGPEDLETSMQDLLTDMMHLARLTPGFSSWDHVLDMAYMRHDKEAERDPEGPKDWRPGA